MLGEDFAMAGEVCGFEGRGLGFAVEGALELLEEGLSLGRYVSSPHEYGAL